MSVGVLTSGGDAPGMNAAIRAVVRRGVSLKVQVFGIRRGYEGLLDGEIVRMGVESVGDIIHRGGTVLHTARSDRMLSPEGLDLAAARVRGAGLSGLVVIGGEGSLHGMMQLCRRGVRAVGVPATIDNDVAYCNPSIGFDTAANTGVQAVNKLRDTATSHDRMFVVETMGRRSGHLALSIGIAGGAEAILVPELRTDMDEMCRKLRRGLDRGKVHSIVVVAEGAASGFEVAQEIEKRIGLETRITVLGHVQRGGDPTAMDRVVASRLGAKAMDLLANNEAGVVVGMSSDAVISTPVETVLSHRKNIDMGLYRLAQDLAR